MLFWLVVSDSVFLLSYQIIGIAGTDEKCEWVEKLGADACVNYKSPSFKQDLIKETEGFVEIYFGKSLWPLLVV